ncbi:hypothetical protein EYF80_009538 [Liparis tanakae]|uniref:Secreted protein n=1 Tax=Liparis tanakae TaxID=230148 RepID=A0A4Z2ISQ0_9TELE|nr:hypothetical protein EYF80_009538 [Liparis tanakae]
MKRVSAPALMACLGRQRVVVAFAALALAAEDDGSGQEEERGGDQQEQAKSSEDPHNLQRNVGGDGQVVLLAGLSRVPVGLACGAELEGADGTLDQLGERRRISFLQLAHGLAGRGRAPRPAWVQQHL